MNLTSEEKKAIISYRLEKSNKSMKEAQDNAKLNNWSLVAQRLYYSAYYVASALLLSKDLYPKSHNGVISLLNQQFVSTNILDKSYAHIYSRLFEMRQTGDYDDCFDFTKEDVEPYFEKASALIKKLNSLIKG
jgi:uncharacterized protein (UPF0332 family)